MRKFVLLVLLALNIYLAGMFRSLPLMILLSAAVVVSVILSVIPQIAKNSLTAEFSAKSLTAAQDEKFDCGIRLRGRSRLPTGRIKLKLRISYRGGRASTARVYITPQTGEAFFTALPPYSGLLTIQLTEMKVYDPLMIFSAAKELSDTAEVAVLPKEQPYTGDLPLPADTASDGYSSSAAAGPDEIKQIREYAEGDPIKHIHRNISARTDKLYVKEYEEDSRSRVRLFIDLSGAEKLSEEKMSGFYGRLYSLVCRLTESGFAVTALTFLSQTDITDRSQLPDLLCSLYKCPPQPPGADIPADIRISANE